MSIPTFNGIHNRSKCLIWLILYYLHNYEHEGLNAKELSLLSGVSYKSIVSLLTRWTKWHYIGYHRHKLGRRYHILQRGLDWIEKWYSIMPLGNYISILRANGFTLIKDYPQDYLKIRDIFMPR